MVAASRRSTSAELLPKGVTEHYPFRGRWLPLQDADGNRVTMHYLDEGRGEPLLFVHGNPTWSFYWRNLVKGLSDKYRCVAVDHIGCGLSDKPQDYPYTLQQHVENLTQLIDALDLRDITVVVHDWGGPIGLGAALKHSDRVKRLVIFNTGCFEGPIPAEIRMCRVPYVGDLAIRMLNGFVRVGLLRATSDRSRFKNGVAQGYLAPYDSYANRIANLRFVQDIPLEADHPTRAFFLQIGEQVRELADRPTMIVWGMKDFCFTPHYLEGWKERFPKAEVHALDDASHWIVEDAHERILPLMRDFLERHALVRT